MEDLPAPLLLDILGRLSDSADVARCRVASRAINSLAPDIRSVHLYCSHLRYAKSRSPLTRSSITPFKHVFCKLLSDLHLVEHVFVGIDKLLRLVSYDDVEDEDDDLFLTDVDFLRVWLPNVCPHLKSISISDFWVQSCWRRTDMLSLISSYCCELLELEVKNAWLSVDGLTPMPNLTVLTLEFIRLDDENLEKLNDSFPLLRVLNLIGVGGLKEPKLHLMHLRTCYWSVSNAPTSITIIAPSLLDLTLTCVKPNLLFIETPLLSSLNLSVDSTRNLEVNELSHLKRLHLESSGLRNLLAAIPVNRSVENLTAVSTKWESPVAVSKSIVELLLHAFPSVSCLTLTSRVWSELETHPGLGSRVEMKGLKEITAYLTVNDIGVALSTIFLLLDSCSGLSNMAIFIHRDVVSNVTSSLISTCTAHCTRVKWKWGMWKEGTTDLDI
ncbi:F-box/LRR-repeat protein-like protein [Salvia divinorum]|uniref:F-box/LRR-repeat protein-like protein n=1 Tax=Salvia divinorum TaxID=28513 RepID=A0ABD1HHH3_SALDI